MSFSQKYTYRPWGKGFVLSLLKDDFYTDFTLLIGPTKQEMKIHKVVVGRVSTFFNRAFKGTFKEGRSNVMELPEEDIETMREVMKYVYTGRWPTYKLASEIELHFSLFIAGDKYGIESLRRKGLDFSSKALAAYLKTDIAWKRRSAQEEHEFAQQRKVQRLATEIVFDDWDLVEQYLNELYAHSTTEERMFDPELIRVLIRHWPVLSKLDAFKAYMASNTAFRNMVEKRLDTNAKLVTSSLKKFRAGLCTKTALQRVRTENPTRSGSKRARHG